MVKRKFGNSPR